MNFFKLYIGDYQRDTAHLSVTEHGAYLLMLQHYYATEKPLPTGKALHRMLRAQDRAEREAIDAVVSQFWTTTEEGLVNKRADQEITKAGAQAETNRTIAVQREARRKARRTEHEQSTNRATNEEPNQTPDTRHQTEDYGAKAPASSAHKPAGPSAAEVCIALRNAGIAGVNPGHPRLTMLLDAGAVVAEFVAMAPKSVDQTQPFAYLLAAVEGERKRAADTGPTLHRGPLRAVSKQQAIEDENRRVAEAWAAQGGAA